MTVFRDDVFVAGGQPTVTYVDRQNHNIESNFVRAIATPNQIVSLSGPTKTGKTVLCKKALGDKPFVWIDGGQVESSQNFWVKICAELNIPSEETIESKCETTIEGEAKIPLVVTLAGSQLFSDMKGKTKIIDGMAEALETLQKNKIILVIDDFHYLSPETRKDILRNLKGAIFNGLKVILLSVTHRVFDALKAESELTGRFTAVTISNWETEDLFQIPVLGFKALNVECPKLIIKNLASEAQENPFLMQKFCWEICFDCGIDKGKFDKSHIPDDYDLDAMFIRISQDAGLPIYKKLAGGPQSRKARENRPLKNGKEADIYEVLLEAIAATGPKATIKYDEIRNQLNYLLKDKIPQKNEVTSAFKHLAKIARESGLESAIDWDDDNSEVSIADPYLRFYLRWQVRNQPEVGTLI